MPERILEHLLKPLIGLSLGAFVDVSSGMLFAQMVVEVKNSRRRHLRNYMCVVAAGGSLVIISYTK